jgi:DNA (cytosine-5)-methyltransferase 1
MMNRYTPTAKSYFSGAGLMDLGLSQAGIDITQSLELEEHCVNTLRLNVDSEVKHMDIKDILVSSQDDTDIIVGTYPCNKYSAIADIHGTRTGDDLFLHFFRHIALEQPEMYIVENVPGMRKFAVAMEAMSELPDYYVKIWCPVKTNYWLPQKRDRLILIGTRKPFRFTDPTIGKPVTLKDIISPQPDMAIEDAVINRLAGKYRDKPIISDPDQGHLAPTAVAHYAKDRSTRLVVDKSHKLGVRPYTVREYARLMGIPDDYKLSGPKTSQYRQIGNGVPVPLARWIGGLAMNYFNTLNN